MELIRNFSQLSKSDAHLAGGKGASLGEMTNSGIPVPPGFVILSTAFEQFLQETDLNTEIDSILHTVNHQEMHTVEHASETIQKLILEAQMPESIEKEIKKEFKKLKAKYVAVRSSATAEDSSSAAWAGQLETYLNTEEKTLLPNVQKCFASLFTPRAIFYRFEKGMHNQKISVAVVIQKMVASEKSGIAFSVHPVTEDRNQLIIEAGYGLGESIVSGQITPDSYVVEKNPRRIIDKNISEQTKMLQRKKEGGSPSLKTSDEQANEWVMVPYSKQKKQVLSDQDILKLSQLILKIENHYGTPQDIEWAFEKNKFYIVQSRPVTTLATKTITEIITEKKVILNKNYERDLDLVIESAWANGFVSLGERFRFKNPYMPVVVFYATKESLQIWEHENAVQWFKDWLLEKNSHGDGFIKKSLSKYSDIINRIRVYLEHGPINSKKDLKKYIELLQKGVTFFILWYYTGLDDRTPLEIRKLVVAMREHDEFFAQNSLFIKGCIEKLGGKRELANLVFLREFPIIPPTEELERRAAGVVVVDGKETHLSSLKDFAITHAKYQFTGLFDVLEHTNTIVGQGGYTGNVKGIVRILKNYRGMDAVRKGDILVSPMTTPDFLPAMQRASAFITDEGGIMCHAAIVARELKKPCIIGTKIATQVLHDGDLVEVDAERGIVTILKKADANNSEKNVSQSKGKAEPRSFKKGGANKGVVKILKRAEERIAVVLKSKTKNAEYNINEIVEKFAKTKWHFVHKRSRSPLYTSLLWEGVHLKTKTEIPFDYSVAKIIYLNTEIAIDEESWEILRKRVVNFTKHNPNALSELLHQNYKINESVEKFVKKTKKQVWSLENLRDFWNKYHNLLHRFGAYIILPLFIEEDLEKELKNAVIEKYGQKSEKIYQILTTPIKTGAAQEEELALLKLAILKNKNKLNDSDINAHLEKFSWIANNAFNGNFMTKAILEARIDQVSENHQEAHFKNYTGKIKSHKREFEKYYNDFSNNTRIQGVIDVLQESIFYRSWRTERYYRNAYYMQDMFAKTANILGLKNGNDIFYLTIAEIIEALESNSISNDISISERKAGYVCFAFDNKVVAYSGEKLKIAKQNIQLQEIYKDKKEIKGQTAYPGKVRGIVSIVISKDDLKNVKEESVLVSPSTTVDYVTALKKVIAIVTEEGGVLSHASVISRELHIPCIIGTKIATQVLRDGDLVEVDAERGIVTILKKADANNSEKNVSQSKGKAEPRSFKKGGANKGVVRVLEKSNTIKSQSVKEDEDLADQYITLLNGRKLYPPLNNYSAFIQGSEYNTERYAKKWWKKNVRPDMLISMQTGKWQVLLPDDDFMVAIKQTFQEYVAKQSIFTRRMKILDRNIPLIDKIYKKYSYSFIGKATWKELFHIINKTRDLIWDANAAVFFCIYLDKEFGWSLVNEMSLHISRKRFDYVWEYATHPFFESFDKQQTDEFLFLLKKKTSWQKLIEQCQYFATDYHSAKTLKEIENELKKRYAGALKNLEYALNRNKIETASFKLKQKQYQNWLKRLSKEERLLANFLQIIMETRDRRKNFFAKGLTIIYRIAERMFAEAGLDRELIPYYTMRELLQGTRYLVSKSDELKQRPKGFQLLIPCDGEIKMILQPIETTLKKIKDYYFDENASQNKKNIISGQSGSKGKIQGRVRIVLDVNSKHGFQKGEILVTGMTRPEYVPLMKQATGIVTDEGGITCHAAIVSRELGIPCVIGTKFATHMLKTGDLVEVDADKGVVKILKKVNDNRKNISQSKNKAESRSFKKGGASKGIARKIDKKKL